MTSPICIRSTENDHDDHDDGGDGGDHGNHDDKDNNFEFCPSSSNVFSLSLKDFKKSCVKDARGYLLDISIITSCRLSKCLKAAPTSSVSLKKQFKLLRILFPSHHCWQGRLGRG